MTDPVVKCKDRIQYSSYGGEGGRTSPERWPEHGRINAARRYIEYQRLGPSFSRRSGPREDEVRESAGNEKWSSSFMTLDPALHEKRNT